jgi:hypothetical protein
MCRCLCVDTSELAEIEIVVQISYELDCVGLAFTGVCVVSPGTGHIDEER